MRANILERKITAVPHNTWKELGHQTQISLNDISVEQFGTSGNLKISDFILHPQVSLIFKLEFKGKQFQFYK